MNDRSHGAAGDSIPLGGESDGRTRGGVSTAF